MKEIHAAFFNKLNALDNGDRAALRRAAGSMLRDADGKAITAFYRCLPFGVAREQEERWFAVAALRCIWDAGEDSGRPVEQVISSLIRDGELSDSAAHRAEILLDTVWDSDGYMLTKLTRFLKLIRQKSDRCAIDFSALLDDLIYWNAENQSVQRKWAREIFTNTSAK